MTSYEVKEKVNEGFEQEEPGGESKSTVISVPESDIQAKVSRKNPSNTNLLIVAAVFIFILIVGIVVISVFYVREIEDNEDEHGKVYKSPTTGKLLAPCIDENCIQNAAAILEYMNRSADPCEDFYTFACGSWRAKTFIPTTETSVSILWELGKRNSEFMRNLLANPGTKQKYSSNRAVMKAIDYYQTCLSKASVDAQGDGYLKEVVAMLGGSNLTTPNWNSSEYNVEKAMLTAITKIGTAQPFFQVNVFADFVNSSKKSFAIMPGDIGLSTIFYVKENSSQDFYEKTRNSYKQYMVDVMVLFGADRKDAEKQMEEVYVLEKELATIYRNQAGHPHSSTISRLSSYTKFDWHSFLNAVAAQQSYNFSKDETILVQTRRILKYVVALMNSTDPAIVSNYIAWTTIRNVIRYLPNDYVDARLAYKRRIRGESYEDLERWLFCYHTTMQAFPMAIGLMFVDEKLDPDAKARAKEIFEEIRSEFLRELSDQTWMDNVTKRHAKEKAVASRILVGYPDHIKDEEKLNAEYETIQVNRSQYLKTVVSIKRITLMKRIAEYKIPVDRNVFFHSPADVNAYHYRQENKNVFLAGILNPPFYSDRSLRATNYGGIGMIAGHELTHGFDSIGRGFDKDGNMHDWWTRNSTIEFAKKTKCFKDQYSKFQMFGKNVNGEMTIEENTADNGGVKFAYEAYKRWVARNGEEQRLPGLDYTPHQLFFVSYAQAWCSKYTLQGALEQLDSRPWPPMNFRVEGAIMNSEGFAEAFQCPRGSRMNPVNKCSVW
ncbi:endothelin-converting enzyme homolog [Dendronephthya gigantea]|uniref:endothelin-converting enzyme homolog n=1 Tax=Dendronephthya gigantea TaxID=151771 RepID=UPI001069A6FF|nr:endothelin-converting enzyme homolog [Dendronephthya gigantea]